MAKKELTVKNIGGGLKRPAKILGGLAIGIIADRFLAQKVIGNSSESTSATASGVAGMLGLGADTTKTGKKYFAPAIVAITGATLYITTKDETMKDVALGIGAAGLGELAVQAFQGKSITTALSGADDEESFLGSIFGADEDIDGFEGDDDDIDGVDDDDVDGVDGDDDEDGVHGIGELPNKPSLLAIGGGNAIELEGESIEDFDGFEAEDIY
jgi:hypothetical protein